ncbi:MAG: Gfo/Idh/MocA family oxidoreductase [Oligoflexia bacterium]|nr:Gfo/Idh/MocA family oxidoreductase [Oligoflexia bacterium]
MKLAFFGCGYIGEKRSKDRGNHDVVGVYDPDQGRAQKLANDLNTKSYACEDSLLKESNADIIVVATTNRELAPLTLKAIMAKKHVLVEKPGSISVNEVNQLRQAAAQNKVAVKVGFNHRFHPALLKARQLIDDGQLGEMMYLRARYGHGARVGYEKEWRSIPELSGGGELLDQGVHILDLIYWYLGPLPLQSSFVTTSFWDMKVDDNAVLTLSDKKRWATFHVSCSEWKNTFSIELYGRTGKILINGLGRSYGKETLTYYKMLPEMGPPIIETFDFNEKDESWLLDLENLVDHVKNQKPLWGDLESASYALEQVRAAYRQNGYKLPCSV